MEWEQIIPSPSTCEARQEQMFSTSVSETRRRPEAKRREPARTAPLSNGGS